MVGIKTPQNIVGSDFCCRKMVGEIDGQLLGGLMEVGSGYTSRAVTVGGIQEGGVSFSLCLSSAVCGREIVGEMLVKCAVQCDLSKISVNC